MIETSVVSKSTGDELGKESFQQLFENMLDGFAYCKIVYDSKNNPEDFVYLNVNKAFYDLTGLKDVVGKRVTEVIPTIKKENPEIFDLYNKTATTGTPLRFEAYIRALSIWLHISVYSPKTGYFVAVFENISNHKIGQEKLIESEQRYRRLFESAQDGILIVDAETGKTEDVNKFLVDLLGFSHEEFVGKYLWDIGLLSDVVSSKEAFLTLQKNSIVRYEDLPLKTKSGQLIEVEFVSNVYLVDNKKTVQCNIREITARKRMERDLAKSKVLLEKQVKELEKFNKVIVDRELKMVGLKKKIQELEGEVDK